MGPLIDSDKENKSDMGGKVPAATENAKLRFPLEIERLSEIAAGKAASRSLSCRPFSSSGRGDPPRCWSATCEGMCVSPGL